MGVERNRNKTGHEKYYKRLENIAENAGGQDTVARVARQPTDKNPAKPHVFTDSCTEPTFLGQFF
jgi:hypothetical protein